MRKNILLLSFIFLVSKLSCNAQLLNQSASSMNAIHSPNASSLGKYGDVPVSLYTGTPEINIPIHKINERGVELDISLSYDAKGVRVSDLPTWVGQNWTLNAGGIITRTVKGRSFDELNFFHNKDICESNAYNQAEWPSYGITSFGGDEITTNGTTSQIYYNLYQRGYFYSRNRINNINFSSQSQLENLANKSLNYNYFWNDEINPGICTNYLIDKTTWEPDFEPDIFTFNFMGHSGHFFLGHDGNWKVNSNSNLKVLCNLDTDISYPVPLTPSAGNESNIMIRFPKVINKITLVDDKGIKYEFSQTELTFTNITSQRPKYNLDSKCISTAFYLTKVTDTNNNKLFEFEYEKGPWQGRFNLQFEKMILDLNPQPTVSNTAIYSYNTSWQWHKYGFNAPGQLILPCYLKKIKTESGIEINFNSSLVQNALKYTRGGNPLIDDTYDDTIYGTSSTTNDFYFLTKQADMVTNGEPFQASTWSTQFWNSIKNKKLNEILITDNSNNLKKIQLNYIDTSGIRLFLDNVIFNEDSKYKLEYFNYFLPNFLATETDHLGYFNNKPLKFTINHNDYNYWNNELPTLKATDPIYVKYGSLKKIIYPTGGFSEFEFEPHFYSKKINDQNQLISENGFIGGLRIKKIINSDDNGNLITKEYQYTKGINSTVSSGNLLFNPSYYKQINGYYHISLNSLVSMSNFMGIYNEYSDVIEKTSNNGYTHYKFTNYEDFPDLITENIVHPMGTYLVPKTSVAYERGKIKEKLIYNQSNSLQKRIQHTYLSNNSLKVKAINNTQSLTSGANLSQSFNIPYFNSTFYIPYSDKYLIEEKEEIFYPSGILTNIKKYKYIQFPDLEGTITNDGSLFIKQEYFKSSENQMANLKTNTYPFEISSALNNLLIFYNFLPIINEKNELIDGEFDSPSSSQILSERKVDYQTQYNDLDNSYTFYHIFPTESFIKKGDTNFEKDFIYSSFDLKGNLTGYKKENGVDFSIIWGYNQTKPIAIIENLNYSLIPQTTVIALQSLSNSDNDHCNQPSCKEQLLRNELNSLRVNFPNASIKTFTYDILTNVTSITEPNGNINYFEYDNMLRLKYLKDKDNNILKEYEYHFKPNFNPED